MLAGQVSLLLTWKSWFKIALKLVERGTMYAHIGVPEKAPEDRRRSQSDKIRAHALIHSPVRSIKEACKGASAVIATADSQGIVMKPSVPYERNAPPILIDGKGCFSENVMESDAYRYSALMYP
jgi:hypothetical protein